MGNNPYNLHHVAMSAGVKPSAHLASVTLTWREALPEVAMTRKIYNATKKRFPRDFSDFEENS